MKEREPVEHQRLHPEVESLLGRIEDETGRPVEIRPDNRIRDRARAVYLATDPDPDRHLILYDPDLEPHLSHLVAHECGHIIRLAEADPDDKTVPIVTITRRARAISRLLPELYSLAQQGVPAGALTDLTSIWLSGTVAQLADTPSDIRIERWISHQLPDLRLDQEDSLEDQLRTTALGLRPVVVAFTPRSVWQASTAMNYALAKSCAVALDRPDFVRPFRGTSVAKLGGELVELFDRCADNGLAGDRRVSEAWASRLGIREWFEWRRVDELPAEFQRMWEAAW